MTINVPQVIALFSLSMKHGRDAKFTVLASYISGNALVEMQNSHGTQQYTLFARGGCELVQIDLPKEVAPA